MTIETAHRMEPDSLAARLNEAALQTSPPESALLRFINRHWGKTSSNDQHRLPSGLEPDEAAGIASAIAATLPKAAFPVTQATFKPENIRLEPSGNDWQVFFSETNGPTLDDKGKTTAFAGLLFKLATGQELTKDLTTQLGQLQQVNPDLAKVFEEALNGRIATTGALAGRFGWSLYRKTHLSFPALKIAGNQAKKTQTLPEESSAPKRSLGGPLALGSLLVAMVLLAGTIAFSVSDLNRDYSPQSLVSTPTVAPTATAAPTPTAAMAMQVSRQTDGSSLTRYNPAFDQPGGSQYTDPAKLTAGQVAALTNFRELQIQNTSWSADGKQVNLALKDGGFETWDIASKKRLGRKELPNPDLYRAVSWSPDGKSFAAVSLDNQLSLGKDGRVVKTVALTSSRVSSFSTYPWPFSWSPNSLYLLLTTATNNLQLYNFENLPTQVTASQNNAVSSLTLRGNNLAATIVWSGDSQYLARLVPGSMNAQVEVYNPRNLARLYTMTVTDVPGLTSTQTTGLTTDGSPGLAWSPDGRYMAIIRYYHEGDSGAAKNTSTGALVTVLEVPDGATIQKAASSRAPQVSPVTPSGRVPTTTPITTLTPPHLETITIPGLTDVNTAGGRNLAWSKNGRLLVTGNPVKNTASTPLTYLGVTLDLQAGSDTWKWQAASPVVLPFQTPFNYLEWLPDNQQILFNTTDNMLGTGALPGEGGRVETAQTLYAATQNDYSYFQQSPDGQKFLQIRSVDRAFNYSIRDSATGEIITNLDVLSGAPGAALWSANGQFLAIPFIQQTNSTNGAAQTEQIIRVWFFGTDKKASVVGDMLLAAADDRFYFNFNNNMAFDGKDSELSLLFETTDNRIARWDLTQPRPPVDEQRKTAPTYEIVGQIPGKVANTGTGNWTWLPDHKRLVYCAIANCFIQSLLEPDATFNSEKDQGIAFDPQPVTGTASQTTNGFYNPVVSPDGRMVAVGLTGGLVNLYDAATGKLFQSFTAHQAAVDTVSFSPDGKYLVTSGVDRAVKVWDTTSWRQQAVLRLTTPTATASQVLWLADNKTLMVGAAYSGNTLFWRALP